MKSIFVYLILFGSLCIGCNQKVDPNNHLHEFIGEWVLEKDSYTFMNRGCISMDIEEASGEFEIIPYKDYYLIKLNNGPNTTWQSSLTRNYLSASQILNTSRSGRICGEQINVRLVIRLDPKSKNIIKGKLDTPTCDPCPSTDFVAYRKETSN